MEGDSAPSGWVYRNLGEVLEKIVGGGTPPKGVFEYFQGSIPLMTVKDMTTRRPERTGFNITQEALEHSSSTLVPADTIIIATRMGLGKVVRPKMPAAINQDLKALFPSDALDKSFLELWLISVASNIEAMGTGTTVKGVRLNQLRELEIPLPPLNEQRRIVDKIETLFARLEKGEEALREVQRQLSSYRQSVLKAAVTGQLTADWRAENAHRLEHGRDLLERILQTRRETWQGRGKYKEPVAPDSSGLPPLPEGWVWASLPMLGDFGRGKSKHRPRNDLALYSDGEYPFLQTGRVRSSQGKISRYDALYNDLGLAQSRLWPIGTICITIAANIAESGILEIEACFPDSVVGLIPHSDIDGEYIESFIRTAKNNLDHYAPATAQKNINLEILNELAVPLPPKEEQTEIENRLGQAFAAINVLESSCEAELARSAALRQSILKDAFAGRLVPQDPNDEPASELLARIQSERPAKAKRSRRMTPA